MTIDNLVRSAGTTQDAVSIAMLRQGLDSTAGTVAKLLEGLPSAPQPAHLGKSVDLYA